MRVPPEEGGRGDLGIGGVDGNGGVVWGRGRMCGVDRNFVMAGLEHPSSIPHHKRVYHGTMPTFVLFYMQATALFIMYCNDATDDHRCAFPSTTLNTQAPP